MSQNAMDRIEFACSCGVTLRTRANLAGQKGRCKSCGHSVVIPQMDERALTDSDARGRPRMNADLVVEEMCSICQCPVEIGDPRTPCNECGLPFHDECWSANFGCSAYGCGNVNVLKSGPDIRIETPLTGGQLPPPLPRPLPANVQLQSVDVMPWEYLCLAASVLGSLLGVVMYGLPTILVAIGTGIYLGITPRRPNVAVAVISLVICAFGFVGGFIVSLLD